MSPFVYIFETLDNTSKKGCSQFTPTEKQLSCNFAFAFYILHLDYPGFTQSAGKVVVK